MKRIDWTLVLIVIATLVVCVAITLFLFHVANTTGTTEIGVDSIANPANPIRILCLR